MEKVYLFSENLKALKDMLENEYIVFACKGKTNSRMQRYMLSDKGLVMILRYLQSNNKLNIRPESRPESLKNKIINILVNKALSKSQICKKLGYNQISGALKKVLKKMLDDEIITYTHKEKSYSRLQKYKLTSKAIVDMVRLYQIQTDSSLEPDSIQEKIIKLLAKESLSKSQICKKLGYNQISGTLKKVLKDMLDCKIIGYTIAEKPNSRLQKYKLLNIESKRTTRH